jgi:hypothetical protein
MQKVIFLGNGRDFHAIDWYRTVTRVCPEKEVFFATDLIDSEGHAKIVIDEDKIINLYIIDRLLLKNQSIFGNIWRNIVKILVYPFQIVKLKSLAKENPEAVFHAHTMYYMFLSWVAGIRFIGTPQGPDVLVRPFTSKLYKFFAIKSLKAADSIIVDSANLRNVISSLANRDSNIIQNGIDVHAISNTVNPLVKRDKIASIRALYENYRIEEIFDARNNLDHKPDLYFFYPFWEDNYKNRIISKCQPGDKDLGRFVIKSEMYKFLSSTFLAISIPASDSSPRSVYESIFCGCCVAVTYNPWIEDLPVCMKERIFVADLNDILWLEKAITYAKSISTKPYIPSNAALDMFDQEVSMKKVADLFY